LNVKGRARRESTLGLLLRAQLWRVCVLKLAKICV
jgi:hypothetical protein